MRELPGQSFFSETGPLPVPHVRSDELVIVLDAIFGIFCALEMQKILL